MIRQQLIRPFALLGQAQGLVAGYGQITAEFFDAGQSRVLPWARRSQAAALLAAMADPDRSLDLIDPANTGLGHRQVQRWDLPDGWVISARPAHPALVSEEDFIAAQGIRAAREGGDGGRSYKLASISSALRVLAAGRRW